jgi:hypothetical protein
MAAGVAWDGEGPQALEYRQDVAVFEAVDLLRHPRLPGQGGRFVLVGVDGSPGGGDEIRDGPGVVAVAVGEDDPLDPLRGAPGALEVGQHLGRLVR